MKVVQQDINIQDKIKTQGLIIPPQEIRKLADTTAGYVAKNGTSFEFMVMEKEANNPKFSFLQKDDPYRPYYENKIQEFARGIIEEPLKAQQQLQQQQQQQQIQQQQQHNQQQQQVTDIDTEQTENQDQNVNKDRQNKIEVLNPFSNNDKLLKKVRKELKAPDPDQFLVEIPKSLSQLDVDIIKQTAQFVSKNGKKFLVALTEREKQNPQFDFLKPTHELFAYFMNLVDAYSKCLQINKQQIDKIAKHFKEKMQILKDCGERFEYENIQRMNQKSQEELEEEERNQLAQIDWNEFVVVETIDFFDEGPAQETNLNQDILKPNQLMPNTQVKPIVEQNNNQFRPPPLRDQREKEFNRMEPIKEQVPVEEQIPITNDNIKVKADYKRKTGTSDDTKTKCPVCNNMIPSQELNDHLRIELIDPKYREIKKDLDDRNVWKNLADQNSIANHLQGLKKQRPDIFGQLSQITQIEEPEKPQVQEAPQYFGGYKEGLNRTTANIIMMQNTQRKLNSELDYSKTQQNQVHLQQQQQSQQQKMLSTIQQTQQLIMQPQLQQQLSQQQQLQQDMAQKTLVPPLIKQQQIPDFMQPLQNLQNMNINPLEPIYQKIIEEGVQLEPEEIWLQKYKFPIKVHIRVPDNRDDQDDPYGFNGQTLTLEMQPSTQINQVKIMISQQLNDDKTLAYYNIRDNEIFELYLKERGGVRK